MTLDTPSGLNRRGNPSPYDQFARDLPSLPLARCKTAGRPEDWHSNDPERRDRAKAICGGCPEAIACLTWALDNPELADERHGEKGRRTRGPIYGGADLRTIQRQLKKAA